MRVLVLNGSPKKNSDTMHITNAFLAGLGANGKNEVTIINSFDQKVNPCLGCFACWHVTPGECCQQDAMRNILNSIIASDIVIWSYPLYCYGMPSTLKAICDRTLPLAHFTMKKTGVRVSHDSRYDMSKKRFVMIAGCGFPSFAGNFEPAIQQFKNMFGDNATILTVSESPMFNVPEAISLTKPFLDLVTKAGYEFASRGAISSATMAQLAIPMIPAEDYLRIVNSQ